MNIMTIRDIITVAFPETVLNFIFGLYICGNLHNKKLNPIKMLNFVLSAAVVIGVQNIVRNNISNLAYFSYFTTLTYICCFILIWRTNIRQSLISGSLMMFMLISIEIITYPILQFIVPPGTNDIFYSNKFLVSLPSRIIQLAIVFLVIEFKLTFLNKRLLKDPWPKLSTQEKLSVSINIIMILWSVIFNANYGDLFVKLHMYNIDISELNINLRVYFIGTLISFAMTLLLLKRTSGYENLKDFIGQGPDEIIRTIISFSDKKQIELYRSICDEALREEVSRYE